MSKSSIIAVLAIILIGIGSVYVLTSERCQSMPKYGGTRQRVEHMSRGRILAGDGSVLAQDESMWSLHLDPHAFGDRTNVWTNSRVATMIAEKLHMPFSEVIRKFDSNGKRYIPLKTTRDTNEIFAVRNFGIALRLCVQEKIARRYPLGRMACHLTGFCIPSDNVSELPVGGAGVEAAHEEQLRIGFHSHTDITPELQVGLYRMVSNAVAITKCESANAIILSCNQERVRALVSWPDYDPCEYGRATHDQLLNRCIHSLEYPGALLRPLLNPAITNDNRLVHQRLLHLGFGIAPVSYDFPKAASGRIMESDDLWTNHYRDRVVRGRGFVASTYQLAIAYAKSANEANPISRAQSSSFYYDTQTESFTNTVNILEATSTNKVLVLTIKKPASNFECRKYLSALNVDALIAK